MVDGSDSVLLCMSKLLITHDKHISVPVLRASHRPAGCSGIADGLLEAYQLSTAV